MNLLAGDGAAMQAQLDKVSLYSAWSGMFLYAGKCEASAILHATSAPTDKHAVRQALDPLRICGEPLKCVPPTHPFKYLGIQFTLSLNWRHQWTETRKLLEERAGQLVEAPAFEQMKLQMEIGSILGAVRHTFCVAPYSLSALGEIDKIRARVVRAAWPCMALAARSRLTPSMLRGRTMGWGTALFCRNMLLRLLSTSSKRSTTLVA